MWQLLLTIVTAICRYLPNSVRTTSQAMTRMILAAGISVSASLKRVAIELLAAGWCPRRFMVADSDQCDSNRVIKDAWRAEFAILQERFSYVSRKRIMMIALGLPTDLSRLLSRERLLSSAAA